MQKFWQISPRKLRFFLAAALLIGALAIVMLYKLGSLTGGLSSSELQVSHQTLGWHYLRHHVLYLPLTFIRSAVFFFSAGHGQTLTRASNAFFGFMAVLAFAAIVRMWHGGRIALLTTLLFACSAWTLHVSRLASYDVLYLWGIVMLVLTNVSLQRWAEHPLAFYGSMLVWGLLLTIPGFVWLLLINAWLLRSAIADGWQHFHTLWQRLLYVLSSIMWLPLLLLTLRQMSVVRSWLGLPAHFAAPLILLKHFVGVFVHLFIRGPQYPQLWLGRTPILDIFCLVICVIGIYFYARRSRAYRSQLLASFFAAGVLLVALDGPVSLSVLVPLLYMVTASGIAYLLHEWLRVFPLNPLARSLGIGLLILAVGVSCWYNLRAYFLAWPHNHTTESVFVTRLK